MAWCHWVAEESHQVLALEKDGAKPIGGGIALHDEGLLEVGEGQHGRCGDCLLEGGEHPSSCLCPSEPLFFEQGCQRCCYSAKLFDELVVIAYQA